MAVNLTSADEALKTYYLDAITEQLNKNVNPLLAEISQSTENVYGKEIRKFTTYGVNGGIGAGTEDGSLPKATGNLYSQMVLSLKNLYGTIEISDKAIRASENNAGAFVNLLNAEMEGLIKSSQLNFGRMLFGDGTGIVARITATVSDNNKQVTVDSVDGLFEGMCVEFGDAEGTTIGGDNKTTITGVNRQTKTVTFATAVNTIVSEDSVIAVQGSYNKELTGLKAIFSNSATLYGLNRAENSYLIPYSNALGGAISESVIQTALDAIEENSGSAPNFIICSWGVRRALQAVLSQNRRTLDSVELAGGYKAMSYNGIPIVAERFCPKNTMYLLNTNDFTLHQLCDWQWLESDDGKVLKQVAGKPVYTATLVKYADLMCARPCGQGVITGITEA